MNKVSGELVAIDQISNKAESTTPVNEKVKRVVKAKEAEDLGRPARITRSHSMTQLIPGQKTEKEEIAARNGTIWTCVSRKPNKLGGYIYNYQMKYDSESELLDRMDKIFPAVETTGNEGNIPFVDISPFQSFSIHRELGYSYERKYERIQPLKSPYPWMVMHTESKFVGAEISLLDRDALMANWEKLRETRPNLLPLDVVSGEGIADDMEFVESYFSHDVLLSSGKEFVHDSIVHVLPVLQNIGIHQSYNKQRFIFVKSILKMYRPLMIAKKEMEEGKSNISEDLLSKLNLVLGYITDVVSSFEDMKRYLEHLEIRERIIIERLWEHPNPGEKDFIVRRFGVKKLSNESFSSVWEKIKQIEADFDAQRKKN